MYFNKLLVKNFGKFNNREIELKKGLNLIYGENESGKTTIKEFIVGMLYGIDKSRGLGARLDNYELRKPLDGRGYAGKAYIQYNGRNHLIERSFLRYNKKTTVMDIQSGREVKLRDKNSLHGTMFDIDKNTYVNTLCIGEHGAAPGKELANKLGNYLGNLSTTGSADIDKTYAIEHLKEERRKYDTRPVQRQLDDISEELSLYEGVEDDIANVRGQIADLEQEFAMEVARRKREARRLIETEKNLKFDEDEADEQPEEAASGSGKTEVAEAADSSGKTEVTEEAASGSGKTEIAEAADSPDKTEAAEKVTEKVTDNTDNQDNLVAAEDEEKTEKESAAKKLSKVFAKKEERVFLDSDLWEDTKVEKPLTERLWFIILTGIFVIAVIAAMVYILPFEKGVRQLFIVCTALFVIVTIVEGLYAKGVFDGDVNTPSEEEFREMIYRLERKTESYEDVEIDMSFAGEYADRKAELRVVEKELLDKKMRKQELTEEFSVLSKKRDSIEREVHAINLAINTINEVSAEIHGDLGYLINDNISDIVSKITNGKYQDVYLDENLHVMVRDNDNFVGIEYLSAGTMEQIYLAVRLSVARLLCRDKMPLIIDDIFANYDEPRLINTLDCLKTIDTEQIILMTSNPHIGDMLDDLDMDYNYVEL